MYSWTSPYLLEKFQNGPLFAMSEFFLRVGSSFCVNTIHTLPVSGGFLGWENFLKQPYHLDRNTCFNLAVTLLWKSSHLIKFYWIRISLLLIITISNKRSCSPALVNILSTRLPVLGFQRMGGVSYRADLSRRGEIF